MKLHEGLGWKTYKCRFLFRSGVKIKDMVRVWDGVVRPVILYRCERKCMSKKRIEKLRIGVRRMERSMRLKDKKSKKWIEKETSIEDIGKAAMRKKWIWV